MYPVIQPYHICGGRRHHIYFEEVVTQWYLSFSYGGPGGGIFPNCDGSLIPNTTASSSRSARAGKSDHTQIGGQHYRTPHLRHGATKRAFEHRKVDGLRRLLGAPRPRLRHQLTQIEFGQWFSWIF